MTSDKVENQKPLEERMNGYDIEHGVVTFEANGSRCLEAFNDGIHINEKSATSSSESGASDTTAVAGQTSSGNEFISIVVSNANRFEYYYDDILKNAQLIPLNSKDRERENASKEQPTSGENEIGM